MGKKKLWEADLKSFLEGLKAAKEMVAQFFLYFTRHVFDKASEFTNKTMGNKMEKMECLHCCSTLTGGVALCGECGREINSQETCVPKQEEEKRGRNNIYVRFSSSCDTDVGLC